MWSNKEPEFLVLRTDRQNTREILEKIIVIESSLSPLLGDSNQSTNLLDIRVEELQQMQVLEGKGLGLSTTGIFTNSVSDL